ncbi:hypothetical protein AK812_SmicGene27124 [Symbiodinium microadriaticum]|uniref:Uncharacterized protein n=1 Tax=Symbiodinium microadriaticum TaxID=2951 RepID=A0A1Q9D7S9_SYMMI|nr:hypothetical protein AK812_SmicGene27124 [Symbiodinium microadriaticum]
MITTVLCWEWSKKTVGGVGKAIKLKMLSSSTGKQKLSKSEGKELLSLLNKGDRSTEQDARLATLIGIFQAQGVLHSDGDSTPVESQKRPQVILSSKPTSTTLTTKEKFQPEKWSRGVQTDPEPHVPPQAVRKSAVDAGIRYIVQPWEDDLYVSPNGEVLRGNVEANHESVEGLVNGVAAAPLRDGLPISGIQVGTVNPLSSDGVVATQEQVNVPMNEAIHAVVPGQGQTLSTPSVGLEDGCGYLKQDGVTNDPSIKVIQEDFSVGEMSNLSWKDLLEVVIPVGELKNFPDWLEVIDGPLRDISDSSSWWWDAVKKRACDSYRIWVASGPYERNALAGDGRNGSSRDGGEINHEISSSDGSGDGGNLKDRDVTFRTQLVKSRLGVDVSPTWEDGRPGNPAARSLTTEPEPQPTPPTSPTTTGEAASSAGTAGTGEMKEVLRDAAQALKSLMSSGSTASSSSSTLEGLQRQLDELKLKALSIKNEAVELRRARRTPLDVRVEEGVPTLIDSGATHILRQPRDGAEMASATRVSVTLANDEKRDLLQAESGAILSTSAETQPILPMAELVSAGCEISWKKGNFKVVHPVWGELRTTIRGGCPELAQEQAAKLVNEIEDKKLKELKDGVSLLKAKLEQLVHEEKLPWITYVERYLEGGLAKDLWKGLQGSFMKILSEHMLDPLCQGINLEKDGTI